MAKILSRLFALRALHTFKKDLNSSCYTITRALSAQPLQEDLERTPLLHYSPPPTQAWIRSFNSGDKLGIIDLDPRVFGSRPRVDILQRVVVWQLAKKRAGTAKVKDRGEVRGGGRKPRQQKGSGRARQGSIRAPHYVGGGVVHGPRGPVSYEYTLPKKVRKLGLRSALSIKYAQGDLQIVDALSCDSHKTRDFVEMMATRDWTSVLLVDGGDVNSDLCMATQNLEKVDVLPSIGLNVYSVLSRETLVLSVGAVRMIEQRLTMDFCEPFDNVLEDSVD
ncbi:large ribosomal subunit protein uL4-like [Halichondria panicea]|uniref:large ribosomal subunit protein uL4-like n=1 Tax=Halichondria panicea TaxID=6063 RepID=UPI00312BA218